MSNINLNRLSTEIEIAANSTKSLCRALSFLHESFADSGHDAAGILLLLSNAAFNTAEDLTALEKSLDGADETDMDKAALLKRRDALKRELQDLETDIASTPDDNDETHEIELRLSPTEKELLATLAQEAGKPVEEFAARLIMERLKLREVEGFAGELLREQLVNLSKAPA